MFLSRFPGRFVNCRRGNITVLSALAAPVLLGLVGLAVEYGNAMEYRLKAQRVADAAAYAAAIVYNGDDGASITSVVRAVAGMNGVAAAYVTASLVAAPSGSGNQAIQVTVTADAPLVLTRLVAPAKEQVTVSATAVAEIKGGTPGCVVALKASGTGVTMSGGASLTAAACAVQSNNSVTVPCGTTITTKEVSYNSAGAPSQPCSGIVAPSGSSLSVKKRASVDPLADNASVAAVVSRVATVQAITSPGAPASLSGPNLYLDYANGNTANHNFTGTGCTGSQSGGDWTITCTGAGPFNFGTFAMQGGTTVNFNVSGSASAVYNFTSISTTGTANFGPGAYNVRQGILTGGGSTTTFGAGTFNIGRLATTCGGIAGYSICHPGTMLTFGGPSTFVTQGGILTSGGATLTLGSGSTNSFNIGAANDGNAFNGQGGAKTFFADATGGVFRMAGNLAVPGGGSCTRISVSPQHDINGSVDITGGIILGAGVYTIDGYVAFGAAGGGNVNCWGALTGLNAVDVTLVASAAATPASGTCAGQVFCVGAGYGNVILTAPASGANAKLAFVGPLSTSVTAGAKFTQGASGTSISGAFYVPNGAISMSGAASVGSGAGQCLQLIGSQVSLSGGSTAATACISSSSATGSVLLVG